MSTHNIVFFKEMTKIIFQLSTSIQRYLYLYIYDVSSYIDYVTSVYISVMFHHILSMLLLCTLTMLPLFIYL